MCWIKYFLREAKMRQLWKGMSIEEREKEDFMHRLFVLPKELGLVVRKGIYRKEVLELWRAWIEEKRTDLMKGAGEECSEEWKTEGSNGGERNDTGRVDVSVSLQDVEL
jgi:hypothetical protein